MGRGIARSVPIGRAILRAPEPLTRMTGRRWRRCGHQASPLEAPLGMRSNCFRCASGAARRETALAQVRENMEPTGGFEPPTC